MTVLMVAGEVWRSCLEDEEDNQELSKETHIAWKLKQRRLRVNVLEVWTLESVSRRPRRMSKKLVCVGDIWHHLAHKLVSAYGIFGQTSQSFKLVMAAHVFWMFLSRTDLASLWSSVHMCEMADKGRGFTVTTKSERWPARRFSADYNKHIYIYTV